MRKLSITILAVFYIVNAISAQPDSKLIGQMKQLQRTYKEAANLKFDIEYVYATESKPKVYLDSMKGNMTINGSNYRLALNGTETIKNDRYIIHVFKDDKLIYLTKASAENGNSSPGMLIDSAFANISNLTFRLDSNASTKKLTLTFPQQSSYKTVVFTINNATGYITNTRYVVKTEQLLESRKQESILEKEYDEYGVVEATFSNYRKVQEDTRSFDDKSFFVKNGNEYVPVAQFKDFSIFLGSPNL